MQEVDSNGDQSSRVYSPIVKRGDPNEKLPIKPSSLAYNRPPPPPPD